LTIGSKTSSARNGCWYSTTGRRPVIAAPIAKLAIACSEAGVSSTRSGPNRLNSPFVVLLRAYLMSSPVTNTDSSRAISSVSARLIARRYERSGIYSPPAFPVCP
jgi:hypothetical protein